MLPRRHPGPHWLFLHEYRHFPVFESHLPPIQLHLNLHCHPKYPAAQAEMTTKTETLTLVNVNIKIIN